MKMFKTHRQSIISCLYSLSGDTLTQHLQLSRDLTNVPEDPNSSKFLNSSMVPVYSTRVGAGRLDFQHLRDHILAWVFSMRQRHALYPRMAWNVQSSCLCLLNARDRRHMPPCLYLWSLILCKSLHFFKVQARMELLVFKQLVLPLLFIFGLLHAFSHQKFSQAKRPRKQEPVASRGTLQDCRTLESTLWNLLDQLASKAS